MPLPARVEASRTRSVLLRPGWRSARGGIAVLFVSGFAPRYSMWAWSRSASAASHFAGVRLAVGLNASADSGSSFLGWSGACSGTSTLCSLEVSSLAPSAVTASVGSPTTDSPVLDVSSNGNGRVTSSPAGIDCGSVCSAALGSGAAVTNIGQAFGTVPDGRSVGPCPARRGPTRKRCVVWPEGTRPVASARRSGVRLHRRQRRANS